MTGVYVHKDLTSYKTMHYTKFVNLCSDGVFWSATWEVQVDRSDRVPVSGTDQWVQTPRSCRLVALWLCGCTADHLESGAQVAFQWDPLMEARSDA